MELRQLRYFVKAAQLLSFSEAARALNVAQSTLSQQIRQLETELGVPLFERSTHAVSLTEAGSEMLSSAMLTIHDADQCVDRIRDLRQISSGSLHIGVTYSFSPILTEALLSFMKSYPHVELTICYRPMEELMELLRKREVDFALAFRPSCPMADVESHVLFQNRLAAVVRQGHELAACRRLTLDELRRHQLALPTRGLQARNAFDRLADGAGSFRIRVEINEVNILLKLVRATDLVTVLAEDSIYGEPDLRAIPIDMPGSEMTGCVHVLKDTYHKAAMKEFVRLLGESLAVKLRRDSWI